MKVLILTKRVLLAGIIFLASDAYSQVRFYFQYRGIPFYKGGASDFSVLSGVKIDPNKELVLGIGLAGSFTPKELRGDLKFNKSTFSLGFNYYLSRRFYLGTDLALSSLSNVIVDKTTSGETVTGKFFLDYQFKVTYVALRRLHFSLTTGIVDFSNLAIHTTSNLITEQKIQPDIALSLRVYVFQIRF